MPTTAALAQPVVTAVAPVPNARAAARTSPVMVGFSQPLTAGSAAALKVFSAQRGGLRSRGATPAVVSGSTLQFTPLAYPFAPGETVFSTVTTAAASAGGALAHAWVGQFTTAVGGTGRGNFLAPAINPEPTVGIGPTNVVLGDLDGDGDLDFVTSNSGTGTTLNYTISVRFNDGTGNFQPGYDLFSGTDPMGLALGDIDGDGALDLVVANYSGSSVTIFHNNGSGTLTSSATLSNVGYPINLALGDVDGDGDLDIVTANYFMNNTISVYLNNGLGTYTLSPVTNRLPVGLGPRGLALGDLDGDGDLDLAIANDGMNAISNSVTICLNDGAGLFSVPTGSGTVLTQPNPAAIVLGDVDGDGDLDFVTANYGQSLIAGRTLSVRLNDGTGRFAPPAVNADPVVDIRPTSLAIGDIDADGDLDLVVNCSVPGIVNVRLNNGLGSFAAPALNAAPSMGHYISHVALGDIDADGDLDLLTCIADYNSNAVSIRLNYTPQGIPVAVRISGDSLLCNGGQLSLAAVATAGGLAYRWNTGATTAALTVTQPGTYAVTVTFSGGQTRTAQRQVMAIAPAVNIVGDSLLCPGTTLTLVGSAPNATSVLWSTGASTAGLSVTQPGTYTFTARYGSGCSASRRVVVRAPALGITPPSLVCQGGSTVLAAVADGATAYRWSTGATTPTISVGQAGAYSVVATYRGGCTLNATTTVVQPIAAISGDSVGCPARPVTLTATQPGVAAYRWNTGATMPTISVSQTGQYSVVVLYANGCQSTARQPVRVLSGLPSFTLGADTTLCEGAGLLLQPLGSGSTPGVSYRWSTGATTPTLLVQETGTYNLQLATACDVRTVSRRVQFNPCLTLPNVITPNGDRRNDQFEVVGMTGDWMLQVYSRWGQRVFSTPAYHNDWGETAAAGLYYYILQRPGGSNAYRGWLEVVR